MDKELLYGHSLIARFKDTVNKQKYIPIFVVTPLRVFAVHIMCCEVSTPLDPI